MRLLTTVVAVVFAAAPAWAQTGGGGSGGGGSGGGGGGGGGGSSMGGSGGSTASSAQGGTLAANAGVDSGSLLGGFNNTGAGATGGRGGNTAGSATISTNNFLAATYVNALAQGITSGNGASATVGANIAFGSPLYTYTTVGSTGGRTGTTGGAAGTATGRGGATGSLSTGVSFTQGGSIGPAIGRRGPIVGSSLKFAMPPRNMEFVRGDVQRSIAGATGLTNAAAVSVHLVDGTVVLRGQVASDDERRHAENVARLSPGVRHVRNELVVR